MKDVPIYSFENCYFSLDIIAQCVKEYTFEPTRGRLKVCLMGSTNHEGAKGEVEANIDKYEKTPSLEKDSVSSLVTPL